MWTNKKLSRVFWWEAPGVFLSIIIMSQLITFFMKGASVSGDIVLIMNIVLYGIAVIWTGLLIWLNSNNTNVIMFSYAAKLVVLIEAILYLISLRIVIAQYL
jgi:hypothetical protein